MESTQRTRPCAWCGRPTEDVWCSHPCEIADITDEDRDDEQREPIPALYLDSTRRAISRMGSHPQW